jgi:hypothetical protein
MCSLSYAAFYIQQRIALLQHEGPLMRRKHQRNKQTAGIVLWMEVLCAVILEREIVC